MNDVVLMLDATDSVTVDKVNLLVDKTVEATPFAAEAALVAAVLSNLAAAINVITAVLSSRTTNAKHVVRIAGQNFEVTEGNRDRIVKALDTHFGK